MWRRWALSAALALVQAKATLRFVIISSPKEQNIYYQVLPSFEELIVPQEQRVVRNATLLIDGVASKCLGTVCTSLSDQGLKEPQGLALTDAGTNATRTLYVHDRGAQKVFAYTVTASGSTLSVGEQRTVITNAPVGTKWMSADALGNLFLTDETEGKILKVPVTQLQEGQEEAVHPEVLYQASDGVAAVSSPGGVAVDNFFVYWGNSASGKVAGTVVQAPEAKKGGSAVNDTYPIVLAQNRDTAHGVCISRDNIFFTADGPEGLYAVKKEGGAIAEVSLTFTAPRGCAYDGQADILVADNGANAIYSFPANLGTLRGVKHMEKVIAVNGPYEVVSFTIGLAARRAPVSAVLLTALAAAALLLTAWGTP